MSYAFTNPCWNFGDGTDSQKRAKGFFAVFPPSHRISMDYLGKMPNNLCLTDFIFQTEFEDEVEEMVEETTTFSVDFLVFQQSSFVCCVL